MACRPMLPGGVSLRDGSEECTRGPTMKRLVVNLVVLVVLFVVWKVVGRP